MEYIVSKLNLNYFEGSSFLVTGANGLLAGYITQVLLYLNKYKLNKKCTIIALCKDEKKAIYKYQKYLTSDYFQLIIQSVEEEIKLKDSVDYIIHAASKANTKEFDIDPVGVISANTVGTYNILNYAAKFKCKGVLFLSSGAIYGNTDIAIKNIKESDYYSLDPLDTRNCYAQSKKLGENLCYCFYKQFQIPVKIVRISHTYGPGINLNDGRVFSDFINNILNNKDLLIYSNGESKRSFCYISDAIVAFFLILFTADSGEAYNMANNECYVSINQLAFILTKKVFKNKKLNVIYGSSDHLQSNNQGQVSIDTNKLYKIGWKPEIGIEEGFRRTVESFIKGDEIG